MSLLGFHIKELYGYIKIIYNLANAVFYSFKESKTRVFDSRRAALQIRKLEK
jgi:hypothetical protein